MLDINFIGENKDLIELAAKRKFLKFNVSELLELDEERRKLLAVVEDKRAAQNSYNLKISSALGEDREVLIQEMRLLKDELQAEEEKLKEVLSKWQYLMLLVPNIPDPSVPDGNDDNDNQEIFKWGNIPSFNFEPKSHIEIVENLGLADFERGAKVSGFRGYFLKGELARLQFAISQFVSDFFIDKGYEYMITPTIINESVAMGTGYLPQGKDDMYITQDNQYLSATAEIPVMGYYMNEVVELQNLPIKIMAFSSAYRREAGSYNKDTKGLYRLHEFNKFEQVVLCEAKHEESVKLHEELRQNAEDLMQALNIPYHVVLNCSGDLGLGQVKKYDIEAWIPSKQKYGETHSISYFHDFQCRRLNTKYRDESGKLLFAHSLNGTALAFPRVFIPLLENNQTESGAIIIPEVLRKYFGKDLIEPVK